MTGKEASQRYREKHREELNRKQRERYHKQELTLEQKQHRLEIIKQWQEKNPEKRRLIVRRYNEKQKEQKAAYGREYRKTHKQQRLESDRLWRERNPEKYKAKIKTNTERLRASGYITNRILFKAKRILLDKNPRLGICSMCGQKGRTEMHHIKYHVKDPLRDTIEVCARCHRKREQEYGEWRTKKQ